VKQTRFLIPLEWFFKSLRELPQKVEENIIR